MTAPAFELRRPLARPSWATLAAARPVEGWLAVVLAIFLVLPFAWSLEDAGWIPKSQGDTGYLVWLAVGGVAVGLAGAKVGWSRWRAHLVGAMIAGLLLPLLAGGIILGSAVSGFDLAALAQRYHAAGTAAFRAYVDIAILARPFTSQFAHYHIVFGAMVWAAGQFTGFAVFRHRRPFDAVVVNGLLLLANMALTRNDQLRLLIAFSLAALLVLIRLHAFDEQVIWARRQIGDPRTVADLHLRGGASFVAIAVLGALVLTATASSAPLRDLWSDLPSRLSGLEQVLKRIIPTGGDPRGLGGVGFGATATTNGLWAPLDRVAFRVQLPANESRQFKWRAGTYADYSGVATWTWGLTEPLSRNPDAPLLEGTGEDPSRQVGSREVRARISPDAFRDHTILSPATIDSVDQPVTVQIVGANKWFATVVADSAPDGYTVTALIPVFGDVPGGLTENRLRAAGTDYPADVKEIYLGVPEDSLGPNALALLGRVESLTQLAKGGAAVTPYDLGLAMQDYFRDSANFTYSGDVREAVRSRCEGISSVECFATIKTGYCEYYAQTMTILMRQAGIPSRVAYGFLSGERAPDGTEVVSAGAAHWWVESFFPGYGWIEFDPTGGPAGRPVGQPLPIPSGAVVTSSSRPATAQPSRLPFEDPDEPASGGGTTNLGTPGANRALFIAIGVILFIGIAALALVARRRGSRRAMEPDQAWGALARFAGRFGFGPRPAQTVFEYAGALGDEIPAARYELTTVARAKVEVAYGRRQLTDDRLRSLADAYRRLRFAIIRLAIRRRRRPRGLR
ncbi:MAG TPA: transglutaminase domain-containing protein [Candidatus Eisenbacteria bacterium]|nr:transglutaminase domain-containing protein [Candidatus Eisenbacteria bacterium]